MYKFEVCFYIKLLNYKIIHTHALYVNINICLYIKKILIIINLILTHTVGIQLKWAGSFLMLACFSVSDVAHFFPFAFLEGKKMGGG